MTQADRKQVVQAIFNGASVDEARDLINRLRLARLQKLFDAYQK